MSSSTSSASNPEHCLKQLHLIKAVKSKSYAFSRVASQFMNEVDEANEADRYLSECQKAMKDLKSERERYEKMIREIDADIGSVEETIDSLETYSKEKKTWALGYLVGKFGEAKTELNASRRVVGLGPIPSLQHEEQAKTWSKHREECKQRRASTTCTNDEENSKTGNVSIGSQKRKKVSEEEEGSSAKTSRIS
ncbi:zinc finger C4H2 domain-containing protein-like [Oscarella lobularis]|uniref:zinc finger C4H2 domain-containing protein-like n=1 Tax=Oscarella lobularis TaxID=121494 RepID=UPI0033131C8B